MGARRDQMGRLAGALVVALAVAGCADIYTNDSIYGAPPAASEDADIVATSHQVAERLVNGARQPLDQDKPILVASLVDVANLDRSSDLGRLISEQIASRLAQLGFQTREMKFRGSFLVRRGGGEFVLSRDLRDISRAQDAQAVVAGVYAIAENAVYVTLRLIRAEDGVVIGAYDYALPLGPDVAALLDSDEIFAY